jgi:hypothetical protein
MMFDNRPGPQKVQSPEEARWLRDFMRDGDDWRKRALLTRFRLLLGISPNALQAGEVETVRSVEGLQRLEWWVGGFGGVLVGEAQL